MAAPARHYRSYEEFEREELHQPEKFVQNLDDFHSRRNHVDEDLVDLFDKIDADDDDDE